MKQRSFEAVLLSGHKQDAVELPFDPEVEWNSRAVPIEPGRRGHRVSGRINDVAFEGWVVARSRRHYVLVEDEVRERAGIAAGDRVRVVLAAAVHP